MILTLGLDSQFAMTEAVVSAIMDQEPFFLYTVYTVYGGILQTKRMGGGSIMARPPVYLIA